MTFDELLAFPQYQLEQSRKEEILTEQLNTLTDHHRTHCAEYDRLVRVLFPAYREARTLSEVPYIPASLFKTHRLQSIPEANVFKTLMSSGTTGQQVSQIVLDTETARRQTAALSRIMTHVLGPDRLPMILIESASLLKDRFRFSARSAGVLGMLNFGRKHFYALDADMQLDRNGLRDFLAANGTKPFVMFGFTFMVWQYLLEAIEPGEFDLSNGILIHSGGWKKLQDRAVSNQEFRRAWREKTGLTRIYNFYGMVEQVGSVFLEGEDALLYPPNFADVIIRDPYTFREASLQEKGVVQVLSIVPLSYPGHSLLTEDEGVIEGIDLDTCGRKGKAFRVIGRVPQAELRGCSDVHAAEVRA